MVLNLTQELISRLVAIKSLLDLGDIDLVSVAASRLHAYKDDPEVADILAALQDNRYAEASESISNALQQGTRLAVWSDPEIRLLEAELERVTVELADSEGEYAELEHSVVRFHAAHNEALGARIARLLKLRAMLLEREAGTNPERKADYDEARRQFDDFQRDQESQKIEDARTKWELSDDEEKELKGLFRSGSKKCHPDLAAEEHKEEAAKLFRALREAYDEGDLERVRMLVRRAEAGLFGESDGGGSGTDGQRQKERLKAKIAGIRESIVVVRTQISQLKESSTYQIMKEHPEWSALFAAQAAVLDAEIGNLATTLGETDEPST